MSLADLESKYPLIFTSGKPRGGPGWVPMLDVLCARIQARADEVGIQPNAMIAREKWGFLNLRFNRLDPADASMVAYVEELSRRVCEVCGGSGQHIRENYHRTRCDEHRDVLPTWPTSAR
ncbi:hypothetical protein [Acidovorax sp. A1169]|uniref:hypothetical protein n=1 Tax=Acidovorax sp. A1169 TaxID=3059524 RepID=UPI0027380080|nr:hypothetical protein [Acidovorax sp. A1169]MDP4078531.1 hypothetical protein [Acidovorax sp. A1169]